MNSFISSFKPVLLGLAIILCIEAFLAYYPAIQQRYNTNLLVLAPVQKERITRVFIVEKLNHLKDIPARYIQVGDSSGYYGVVPNVIMEALSASDDEAWLNFGCCGLAGFKGYRELFDIVAAAQSRPGYMVVAMTPYYSPRKEHEEGDLAKSLEDAANPYLLHFQSGGLRLALTNWLYQGVWADTFIKARTDTYWGKDITELSIGFESLKQNYGWTPHPAKPIPVPTDACELELENTSFINQLVFRHPESMFLHELETSYQFARKRGYGFILVVNPVPCTTHNSTSADAFHAMVRQFAAAHPDAIIPFMEIRTYPANLFRDKWHLNQEGAYANSREIGESLKPLLDPH